MAKVKRKVRKFVPIGQRLRKFRKGKPVTIHEAAKLAGMSSGTISNIERGVYVQEDKVRAFAKAIGFNEEEAYIRATTDYGGIKARAPRTPEEGDLFVLLAVKLADGGDSLTRDQCKRITKILEER